MYVELTIKKFKFYYISNKIQNDLKIIILTKVAQSETNQKQCFTPKNQSFSKNVSSISQNISRFSPNMPKYKVLK